MPQPRDTGDAADRLRAQPPLWLDRLGEIGQALGVTPLPSTEWATANGEEYPAHTILMPELVEAHTMLSAGKVVVAKGPTTAMRGFGFDIEVYWYADPDVPDRLWCALSDSYPAWLWVPVAPEPDALAEVLGDLFPKPSLSLVDFTRRERGVLGFRNSLGIPHVYSGTFVGFNGHDLDRYLTGVPFVEPGTWGSVRQDDPLRDDFQMVSPLAMVAAGEGTHQQRLGRVPSMTWRTLHSRSYLTFEIQAQHVVCALLSYRPAPESHRRVVAGCNERYGLGMPADVPLDLVGALTGFRFKADGVGEDDHTTLLMRAALYEGDLSKVVGLREYVHHPDPTVRHLLLQVARWYNYGFLIKELALASTEYPDIVADAEELLLYRQEPDDLNVFADHFDGETTFVDEDGRPHKGRWPDGYGADDEEEDADGEERR